MTPRLHSATPISHPLYRARLSVLTSLFAVLLASVSLHVNAQDIAENKSERIISAGGSITEILFELGMQDQIVATDTSSLFPRETNDLPKIGYYRQLSTEGVLSMRPTSVYAANGAGPKNVLAQLQSTGVKLHQFKQEKSLQGLYTLIEEIGKQANKTQQAKALQQTIREQLKDTLLQAQAMFSESSNKALLRPVFLMSANERGLMAAGANTVPNLIMDIVGVDNPYASLQAYKPISIESFLTISPTHVFIPAHQSGGNTPQELCAMPALNAWSSQVGCRLHIVDSSLFLGMTPRLPQAVEQFVQLIADEGASYGN